MQWLFKSSSKGAHVSGGKWVVPAANAIAIAIVVLASMHANVSDHDVASAMPTPSLEIASLN